MDSLVNLQFLVDDAKCFETVRRLRWPEGVRCPICESDKVARHGLTTGSRSASVTAARPARRASTT